MTTPSESVSESAPPPATTGLRRVLGTRDAVLVGLGAMLGAGVFTAFAPAAAAAGTLLLPALALAALVALCNATSTACLAAADPRAGGAYIYGRTRLGPGWGFLAGWGFVVGKTASCAAMALTAGAYALPDAPRLGAVLAAAALTAVNYLGITATAWLTRWLVAATTATLALVVLAAAAGGSFDVARLTVAGAGAGEGAGAGAGALGMLQAAGLLFFAFAGYARIATLAEEVRDPARTILRAVPVALGLVLVLYAAVGVSALGVLGASDLAGSSTPLRDVVAAGTWAAAAPVVAVGAVAASLGVLLSAMAGVGRTTLAMARDRELPRWLAAVHPVHAVPHHAELLLGAVVVLVVLVADVRGAIGASSFGVLLYYAVANASAWTLPGQRRRWLRPVAAVGVAGCVVLAVTLPLAGVVAGAALLGASLAARALVSKAVASRARRRPG